MDEKRIKEVLKEEGFENYFLLGVVSDKSPHQIFEIKDIATLMGFCSMTQADLTQKFFNNIDGNKKAKDQLKHDKKFMDRIDILKKNKYVDKSLTIK